jgi:long-chain acyl-CoA synthetase
MLRRLRIFRMDLPSLKTMTQAGGKLNAKIAEEYIRNAEETGRRFFVMYGQTEATARMSYLPQERAIEKYDSIGIAIPGGSFSLIDGDGGDITEPDVDGELIYKGSNVSMGYAECIADLSKGDENNGVLHTGDIGHRDVDGYYYITGRMKRFVKIWGNRCNLDAIEQLVKTITVNCACVGVDDLITVFVTEPGLDTEIKNFLSEKTGLNIRAFTVKVINAIPKSPTGKLLYSELQKLIN